MKPSKKILLIVAGITTLDAFMGFDLRFTIINILWLIPAFAELKNEK